jgi:mersacidin/lichenicidin family type 2 lantibiotic
MSNDKVIRAWKDPEYRAGLTDAERAALLPSPVGAVELTEAELVGVLGGLDLASPGRLAATSWKPMCNETASWICDFYPPTCPVLCEGK